MRRSFVILACLLAVHAVAALPALEAITAANAARVVPLARLGRGVVRALAWSPDDASFAVASGVGVWLYAADDLSAEPRLLDGQDGAWSLTYDRAGARLATGGADGSVMLWNSASGEAIFRFVNHLYWVDALMFSRDGLLLASADASGVMRVWNTATGAERGVEQADEPPTLLTVAGDESPVVTYQTSNNQATCMWIWAIGYGLTPNCTAPNAQPTPPGSQPAISPDGQRALNANVETGDVWVSGPTGETHLGGFMPALSDVALNGDTITATSEQGIAFVWSASQGVLLGMTGNRRPAPSEVVSSDGRLVAAGGSDGVVHVRTAEGGEVQTLHGHIRGISAVAFSPDASVLASASLDGTVRLWELATGTTLAVLEAHTLGVTGVVFSADGTLLASSSYDGTICLWGVPAAS